MRARVDGGPAHRSCIAGREWVLAHSVYTDFGAAEWIMCGFVGLLLKETIVLRP